MWACMYTLELMWIREIWSYTPVFFKSLKCMLYNGTFEKEQINLKQMFSHHSCFSDGSKAVDEDVTGHVDRRTWREDTS